MKPDKTMATKPLLTIKKLEWNLDSRYWYAQGVGDKLYFIFCIDRCGGVPESDIMVEYGVYPFEVPIKRGARSFGWAKNSAQKHYEKEVMKHLH